MIRKTLLVLALLCYLDFFGLSLGLESFLSKGGWKIVYLILGLSFMLPLRRMADLTGRILIFGFVLMLSATLFNSWTSIAALRSVLPRFFYAYSLLLCYAIGVYRFNKKFIISTLKILSILYCLVSVFYVTGGSSFSVIDFEGSERFGRMRVAGWGEVLLALGIMIRIFENSSNGMRKAFSIGFLLFVLLTINMSRHVILGIFLSLVLFVSIKNLRILRKVIIIVPISALIIGLNTNFNVTDDSLKSRVYGLAVYGDRFLDNPIAGFGYRAISESNEDFYNTAHDLNIKLIDLGLIGSIFQYGVLVLAVIWIALKYASRNGLIILGYLLLSNDVLFWEPKSVVLFIFLTPILYEEHHHHRRCRIYWLSRRSLVRE